MTRKQLIPKIVFSIWAIGLVTIAVMSALHYGGWGFFGLMVYIVLSTVVLVGWAWHQRKGDTPKWGR